MLFLIFIVFILLIGYLVFDYYKTSKKDNLLERINLGFQVQEEEQVSLWDGAADLLQLEKIRNLLYSSALSRNLDLLIRRSAVKITFLQVVLLMLVISIALAVASYLYFKKVGFLIAPLFAVPAVIWLVFNFLAKQQQQRNDDQLGSMVTSLLTTIRAGGTPIQALQATVKNAANPMRDSISNVMNNLQLGRSPNIVWKEWSDFWDTKNTKLLATGIRLKWEAGGQMTTILEHIAESIEFNKKIELRVSTLTAQSKLSAWVLSSLPFALFLLQYSYRPDLINAMLTDSTGTAIIVYAGISTVLGFLWLQQIAKLKK